MLQPSYNIVENSKRHKHFVNERNVEGLYLSEYTNIGLLRVYHLCFGKLTQKKGVGPTWAPGDTGRNHDFLKIILRHFFIL